MSRSATSTREQRLRSSSRPLKRAPVSPAHDIVGKDDDDLSEELPPLDGISGDEESSIGNAEGEEEAGLGLGEGITAFDDPLETLEDEEDPFDDKPSTATAEDAADDAKEASVGDGPERGWLDESDEASTLDIGDADVAIGAEDAGMLDDSTDPDADDDEGLFDAAEGINDGGEEGFDDEEEELREEDLPALDADDDGEVDERSLYEAPESVLDLDPTLPWDRDRAVWTLEALPTRGDASAPNAATFECVATHGARRFAAGSELRVIEADGRASSIALPAPIARMAIGAGADIWMLAFDGSIFRGQSADDAAATTIEAITTWPAIPDGPGAIDIAYSASALWVLDANDDLWTSRDGAATWSREAQRVLAIAADEAEEQLVVIAMDRTGALRELDIARPGARSAALPFATHAALPGASALTWGLALRGRSKLAFAHGAGAWRSVEGSAWMRLPSSAETFAATWLEDGSVLLALGEVEGEREPVRLARAEPRGLLALVAELLPGEEIASDGQPALALGPGIESLEGADLACGAIVVGPFGVRVLKRGAKRH